MRARNVKVGAVYAVKVSGRIVPVQVDADAGHGGWDGTNLHTGRAVYVLGAQRFRYELEPFLVEGHGGQPIRQWRPKRRYR